jgi:hypothetical protein
MLIYKINGCYCANKTSHAKHPLYFNFMEQKEKQHSRLSLLCLLAQY